MPLLLPIPALNSSSSSAIQGLRLSSCPEASLCWRLGRRRLHCCVPNAVYTAHTQSTEQHWKPTSGKIEDSAEGVAISILNERIWREQSKREGSATRTVMEAEAAYKYVEMVKQQQQRGLEKLRGDVGYKVDPYTLRSGDYVIHKKVGIGRFVGIKLDTTSPNSISNSTSKTDSIEYVFIEYADGMAKLPVKQASRLLYRYNLPN